MQKLAIQVRLNEGQMRSSNPHVPYSPEEIAQQAVECWEAGASVVHFHAREPESGKPSTDPELYAEAVRLIKRQCDIITFPTLGASMLPTMQERTEHIVRMASDPATTPDAVPADMLTTNMDWYEGEQKQFRGSRERIYLNTTKMLQELCGTMNSLGVRPVAMMWNVAGVRLTEVFIEMGLMQEPLMCELTLFGAGFQQFGHPPTVKGLQALLDFFPAGRNWQWMVSVMGENPFPLNAYAIANGGHIALGLGDYGYPELGYPTNADLVKRATYLAETMGREVATAAEARQIFGFSS